MAPMIKKPKRPLLFLILSLLYLCAFIVFYLKYVPLTSGFQLVLSPVLFCIFLATLVDLRAGTLSFVFFFPLINNLPYLFGIQQQIPHAPTALILFLVYFFAVIVRWPYSDEKLDLRFKIMRPMLFFSLLVTVSALIAFMRYANYFPFLSDSIYELPTNAIGVSSGGALMSVILTSLNYLSGFCFFFLLLSLLQTDGFLKRVLVVICTSSVLSFGFGWFQKIFDREFGNTLVGIGKHLINSTFKDALSFGVFLSMILPLLLGIMFSFKRAVRILAFVGFSFGILLVFFTGSKSGLLSAGAALFLFLLLSFTVFLRSKEKLKIDFKKMRLSAGVVLILVISVFIVFIAVNENLSRSATISRMSDMFDRGIMDLMTAWRIPLWGAALDMVGEYPLSGVGIGGYIIELPNFSETHRSIWETPQSAENYFLQVGAEMGLIGLAAIFLVFGFILWRMAKSIANIDLMDKKKYLLIGALAGTGAYLINILFHTYIGSFEVKYMFWLLAAVLFSLTVESPSKKRRTLSWKGFWVGSALVVLVFSGFSLWHSTHSLSLENRIETFELYQDFGFYQPERTSDGKIFNWSKKHAGRWITVEKGMMSLDLHASHPDLMEDPVRIKIFLVRDFFRSRKLLDDFIIMDTEWLKRTYDLTNEKEQRALLIFKVDRTWNPKKKTGIPDLRDLGVAVGEIGFN